jgi:hypothetical protein
MQMVLTFFNFKGFIYTSHVPRGKTINAIYIVEALTRFLKVFKQ